MIGRVLTPLDLPLTVFEKVIDFDELIQHLKI